MTHLFSFSLKCITNGLCDPLQQGWDHQNLLLWIVIKKTKNKNPCHKLMVANFMIKINVN